MNLLTTIQEKTEINPIDVFVKRWKSILSNPSQKLPSQTRAGLNRAVRKNIEAGLLFSKEDEWLMHVPWVIGTGWNKYARGGQKVGTLLKSIYAHRIVVSRLIGRDLLSMDIIDHINHNTMDNREDNLRCVTNAINMQNTKRIQNKSGIFGVTFYRGNFVVRVSRGKNKETVACKTFPCPYAASNFYNQVSVSIGREAVSKVPSFYKNQSI